MHQPFIYIIVYWYSIEGVDSMSIWNDAFFISKIQAEKKVAQLMEENAFGAHYLVETLDLCILNHD
jgi:hypothetical protein